MKRKWMILLIAAACVLGSSACKSSEADVTEEIEEVKESQEDDAQTEEAEAVFGEFLAVTTAGDKVTQEIFAEADLTMVNIWGTFCSPCINEMPSLGEISREYEDTGFQIVGIITDIYEFGDETVDEILEVTGADYRHLLISQDLYDNYLYKVQAVPTTVFVDSEGREVGTYTGSRSKEKWIEVIEEMQAKISEEK